MSYIYKATNKVNGKVYIGRTENPVKIRWNSHISNAFRKDSKEYNFKLHRAIRKYGKDAFLIDVIDEVDEPEVAEREKYWIDFYNSVKCGYNTTLGGEGALKYSDEFIIACWESGLTLAELSKKLGISRNTISARCDAFYSPTEKEDRKRRHLMVTNGTPVHQYDLSGNYICTFCSVNEAKRKTGINHIDQAARGERRKAGGYRWSYKKVEKASNW